MTGSHETPGKCDPAPCRDAAPAIEWEPSTYSGRPPLRERLLTLGAVLLCNILFAVVLFSATHIDTLKKLAVAPMNVFNVSPPASPPEQPAPPKPQEKVAEIVPTPKTVESTISPVPTTRNVVPATVAVPAIVIPAPAPATPVAAPPAPPAPAAVTSVSGNPGCTVGQPAYPARARRLRQTGTSTIRVTVAADGSISAASVGQSSGSDALDSAALAVVRQGTCRATGSPITGNIAIRFNPG